MAGHVATRGAAVISLAGERPRLAGKCLACGCQGPEVPLERDGMAAFDTVVKLAVGWWNAMPRREEQR